MCCAVEPLRIYQAKKMAFIGYPELMFAAVCFLFLHHLNRKTLPTNWPIFGMLPSLLLNIHRLHDWVTDYLSKNSCTFVFKGPWFTNMTDMVVTSDPANMRYIFNTNFSNYPKGPEFNEFFDVLGDGIFNADGDSWKLQRKLAHQLFANKNFDAYLKQTCCFKVENALVPILEHVLDQNIAVDLQDLFKRFTFDTTLFLLSGVDPGCLSTEFNKFSYVDALDDVEEAVFYRHVLPVNYWKLQRWLGIGKEKRFREGQEILDRFVAQCISAKREEHLEQVKFIEDEEKAVDLLTSYLEEDELSGSKSDNFLRDTMLNLMLAGRGTVTVALTWFFWLVLTNPKVELKIIEELKTKATSIKEGGNKLKLFDMEELKGLLYLHGAFLETLRLYPSVPFEHKRPIKPDMLPSGHRLGSKTKILPLLYSMGRMEEVWGKDCLEFKPERWISEAGGIKYVPSYIFMAFNSGPRTCLGKEIAFTQMRMVAATLLYNYHIELVKGQKISPKNSIILYMSNGMQAKIRRRV